MHTHTKLSPCSVLDVHDMIEAAGSSGLDGICITDHNTMDIRCHITEGPQGNGVVLIVGMEYGTPDGDFLIFGPYEHILKGMDAENLLTYVHDTGGAAIAAHPFRKDRPLKERLVQNSLVTIIESINGRNSDMEDLKIERFRKRYTLTEIGGSDAHTKEEVGRAVTRFSMPVRTRNDLIYALSHGLCRPERLTQTITGLSQ